MVGYVCVLGAKHAIFKWLKRTRGQCVCEFFVKVRPGCQKYRILQCLMRPGCPPKAKRFIVAGAPTPQKNNIRSRYVCVFVHVLMAKTTIFKSMCVCVQSVCLFFAIRVCVCVQSVCVFVADFSS